MSVRAAALLLGLSSVVFLADAANAQSSETERVVVFPLAGEMSSSDRRLFDAMLISELRRAKDLELVPDDVRQVHVEATRSLGIACAAGAEATPGCAVEVGRLAAARWALIGTGSGDGTRQVRLTLLDVGTEAAASEVSAELPPSGESLSPVLRALLRELLAPTAAGAAREAATKEADPATPATADTPASAPYMWWIGGGSLLAVGAVAALAAGASFAAGAGHEAPLKPGEDPDGKLAARDAWYAGGATFAIIGGAALVAGVVLVVMGGVVAAE